MVYFSILFAYIGSLTLRSERGVGPKYGLTANSMRVGGKIAKPMGRED
jgi:hypothetical protein